MLYNGDGDLQTVEGASPRDAPKREPVPKGRRSRGKQSKSSPPVGNTSMDTHSNDSGVSPRATIPLSDRPARNRKSVDRFAESIELEKVRKFEIEQGAGICLKDIPNVVSRLSKYKGTDERVQLLHKLLYGKRAKPHNAKLNILQFSGYVWSSNEDRERVKLKEKLDKCVKEKLFQISQILDLDFPKATTRKEDVVTKLVEFLECPSEMSEKPEEEKENSTGKKRKREPYKSTKGKALGQGAHKRQKHGHNVGVDANNSRVDSYKKEIVKKGLSKKGRIGKSSKKFHSSKAGLSQAKKQSKVSKQQDIEEETTRNAGGSVGDEATRDAEKKVNAKKGTKEKHVPSKVVSKATKNQSRDIRQQTNDDDNKESDAAKEDAVKKRSKGRSSESPAKPRERVSNLKQERDEGVNEEDNGAERTGVEKPPKRRNTESNERNNLAKAGTKPTKSQSKVLTEALSTSAFINEIKAGITSKPSSKCSSHDNQTAALEKTSSVTKVAKLRKASVTAEISNSRKQNMKTHGDSSKGTSRKKNNESHFQGEVDISNVEKLKEGSQANQMEESKERSNKVVLPSDEALQTEIYELLKEADFNTMTFTDVVTQLGRKFGMDLSHDKAHLKELLQQEMTRLADEQDEGSGNDSSIDEDV